MNKPLFLTKYFTMKEIILNDLSLIQNKKYVFFLIVVKNLYILAEMAVGVDNLSKVVKFPKGIRFQCQRCSRCCAHTEVRDRRILLSDLDTLRIEKNSRFKREDFTEKIRGYHPFRFLMRMVDGKCVFLDEDKTCKIYDFRPLICRCFPFWIERKGNLFEFKASSDCSGIGKGNILDEAFFEGLLSQAVEVYQEISREPSDF
ncbi:MAG: YkgJ family cysteine cluster protein [Candidatus Freyarchaeum deiterrae]